MFPVGSLGRSSSRETSMAAHATRWPSFRRRSPAESRGIWSGCAGELWVLSFVGPNFDQQPSTLFRPFWQALRGLLLAECPSLHIGGKVVGERRLSG